ncbi:MAG TPA: nucleotidyltransferase domain-containing protein [Myxococcota bacterium]|nr:nucleotidyltransferase domain-containing protein [Myxococcota bacterium]HRY95188.1 nucleotidyltransferase domain-containing protein [Myxococcota bacterium]HSA20413.1 nucleotidyltransferase domain-containing protein [Myxococcota bacterium]
MELRELEQTLHARLVLVPEVRFALLFGSQARGRTHPQSDLDLGVYLDPGLLARQRFDLRLRLVGQLGDLGEPDVVVLNDAPALLGHQALLGRQVLVRDREEYVRYFVRTLRDADDERHFNAIHRRAREQRLREGTYGRP